VDVVERKKEDATSSLSHIEQFSESCDFSHVAWSRDFENHFSFEEFEIIINAE
jgi:hypothetical protein